MLIKPTLKFIPAIIATGLALGVASIAIGFRDNLVHSLILHTLTSLNIGYPLILIAFNKDKINLQGGFSSGIILLGLVYAAIGIVAAEIELIAAHLLAGSGSYRFFSGGGLYWFDAIITIVLGFGLFSLGSAFLQKSETEEAEEYQTALTTIPVKKGDAIHLLPIQTITVIEAADKYAYIYDEAGAKYLCDYALGYLAKRLPKAFVRVHRSFIVHIDHIACVRVFDKKRYVLEFRSAGVPTVQTSASYQQAVRELIKL